MIDINLEILRQGRRLDFSILLIFSILTILTRIPFMSKYLYEWDSVNFALAFENFDISLHQPHPPGYIFFVELGRIFNYIFQDPNTTLIFLSMIFSVFTVILIYLLSKKMFTREVGIISGFLLIFNPIFWFYGEIGTIYASQAFFATFIAFLSYQAIENDKYGFISAAVLGLAGGFRQDITIFMFPLWLFCISYKRLNLKIIISKIIIVVLSYLTWFLLTIQFSGGYSRYSTITKGQLMDSFDNYSIFFGASMLKYASMLENFLIWTISGLGIAGVFSFLFLIIYNPENILKSSNLKNPKFIFFILWIMPAFTFFALIFVVKPGYTLLYLPALTIITGFLVFLMCKKMKFMSRKKSTVLLISFFIVFNMINFIFVEKVEIENADNDYAKVYEKIEYLSLNPGKTIIITDDFAISRKIFYSFPEYETYLISNDDNGILYGLKNGNTSYNVPLNASTTNIIWFIKNESPQFKDSRERLFNDMETQINTYTYYLT